MMANTPLDYGCILVVDDAASRRQSVCDLLRGIGVRRIQHAGDASAALAALSNTQVDAVLLAASGAFDPVGLARRIRAGHANPYVPIILITDRVDAPTALSARDSGVTEFLARPLTPSGITRHLAHVAALQRVRPRPRPSSSVRPGHSISAGPA